MISSKLALLLAALPASVMAQGFLTVSQESKHRQTGPTSTAPVEATFFAEFENIEGASSATVRGNAGILNTTPKPLGPDGDTNFRYRGDYNTRDAMLAAYPTNASYTIDIAFSNGPSRSVVIPGPSNGAFSDYAPATPLFVISGVDGTWSEGVFSFDFVGSGSFTVTLAAPYSSLGQGTHYGFYMEAQDPSENSLAEIGAGPLPADTPFEMPSLTFSYGLAEGDMNFVNGTSIRLEAAFFNLVTLGDAGLGDRTTAAFVFGSGTELLIQANASAIPEPSSYAIIVGALALVGVATRRRR